MGEGALAKAASALSVQTSTSQWLLLQEKTGNVEYQPLEISVFIFH